MKNYFEGWYFKIVDRDEKSVFAIIPGVSFDENGNSEAFIQFFDGTEAKMEFVHYSINQFEYDTKDFVIKIGESTFTSDHIDLHISSEDLTVDGKINFGQLHPWPVTVFQPGVMGWYRYVPKMECYHGVLSMDHTLSGNIEVNGKPHSFDEGQGYLEKDYGTSFPRYYIWGQSNNFDVKSTSIMFSLAKIPWIRNYFDGFLAGFLYQGTLFKFATYTGAKAVKLEVKNDKIEFVIQDKKHRLEITAYPGQTTHLASPVDGSMIGRIIESITGKIAVKLINRKKGELVFEGTGRRAGIDIGGHINEIPRI